MKSIQLSNYCRWDEDKGVNKVLNEDRSIDVTVENGIYFRLAIKHNNIKILKTLLEYYENTQLQSEVNNPKAMFLAKQKLQTILQDAFKSFDISKEIQEVLVKYLPTEEVLKIVKTNTSEVGLRIPYLDTNNVLSELSDVQEVLSELHDIKRALKDFMAKNPNSLTQGKKQGEVINDSIQLLQKHYYYVSQDMESVIVEEVTGIIYDNELLNHPDLLKESLKVFNINQIIDISLNLDQGLLEEAVNSNDSSLVLAGLVSLAEENNYE